MFSFQNLRQILMRPSNRWSLASLLLLGTAFGAIAVTSFNYTVHATSTDAFCLLCHSENVEPEYAGTVHSTNHIGVRVSCADCHIPREYVPKLYRKATAGAKDAYHQILGTINTPEKFEAHRMRMATPTWEELSENDSRACRYCHVEARWDLEAQSEKARDFHAGPLSRGKTCIDCHKGVAHKLPEGILPEYQPLGVGPAESEAATREEGEDVDA